MDDPILETDYEALLGRDLKVPLPVSQSRSDASWVQFQQRKILPDQRPIAEYLPPLAPGSTVDVVVVGCGPAGLALAAALGDRGLAVGLVGPDSNFVNTYGVWCARRATRATSAPEAPRSSLRPFQQLSCPCTALSPTAASLRRSLPTVPHFLLLSHSFLSSFPFFPFPSA